MSIEVPTIEEVARHYSAMLDSVNLINGEQPRRMKADEWADCVSRNVEHLESMLTKDYWTDEDMTSVNQAVKDAHPKGGN